MDLELIQGNIHTDSRGTVSYINGFDMSKVIRMYSIIPELGVVRAWQGHQIETKWFFAAKGSFTIKIISIENNSLTSEYTISENTSQVLHIPGGYYNGFEATEKESVLMVFSDVDLQSSLADDFRKTLTDIPWTKNDRNLS